MTHVHHVGHRTDVGRERSVNEDTLLAHSFSDDHWLLIVCDGMGGHEAGDVASQVATQRIFELVAARRDEERPFAVLYDALVAANEAVLEASRDAGGSNMGTTATVVWVRGGQAWAGWVGDSRVYHIRGARVMERSIDHTRVQMLVDQGYLQPGEAKDHPDAHVLTQALGGGPEAQRRFRPTVWEEPLTLKSGDVVLLCSDGLYDLVNDSEIPDRIAGHRPDAAAATLVDLALHRGGHDNVSVIVSVYGQPHAARAVAGSRVTIPDDTKQSDQAVDATMPPDDLMDDLPPVRRRTSTAGRHDGPPEAESLPVGPRLAAVGLLGLVLGGLLVQGLHVLGVLGGAEETPAPLPVAPAVLPMTPAVVPVAPATDAAATAEAATAEGAVGEGAVGEVPADEVPADGVAAPASGPALPAVEPAP